MLWEALMNDTNEIDVFIGNYKLNNGKMIPYFVILFQ